MTEQFGYVNNPLDVLALRRHADTIYDESFLNSSFVDPVAVGRDFLDFQSNLREILRIPEIHRDRLAALRSAEVETEVIFDAFPIGRAIEFYEAIAGSTAVQTTLALDHDELAAAAFGNNQHYSADMYVALEADGVVVDSSEKRLNFALTAPERDQLSGTQILQSFQLLAPPGIYDLVIMARDNTAERVGRQLEQIEVPDLGRDELRLSSLTLASTIERVVSVTVYSVSAKNHHLPLISTSPLSPQNG